MDTHPIDDTEFGTERVKKIVVACYEHTEAGLTLQLENMSIYLLNEEDFGLAAEDFDPEVHEHAIPKFEMARIYLMVCALMEGDLGLSPEERADPVYQMYEAAYQRCLASSKLEAGLRRRLDTLAATCGFHAAAPH